MTWTPPPIWSVPKEWTGERCFVLCGGESIKAQLPLVSALAGRIIAVKHAVRYRPDADVLFWAGECAESLAPPILPIFTGRYLVVRGKGHRVFPVTAKRIDRTLNHMPADTGLSDDPTMVAGYDAGTSAINLAYLFGATEIIVLGMDMTGPSGSPGMPGPSKATFDKHMEPLPLIAADAKRNGVRIVNVSPSSRVQCFERGRLEDFL